MDSQFFSVEMDGLQFYKHVALDFFNEVDILKLNKKFSFNLH
jgi:hypothetical protein